MRPSCEPSQRLTKSEGRSDERNSHALRMVLRRSPYRRGGGPHVQGRLANYLFRQIGVQPMTDRSDQFRVLAEFIRSGRAGVVLSTESDKLIIEALEMSALGSPSGPPVGWYLSEEDEA